MLVLFHWRGKLATGSYNLGPWYNGEFLLFFAFNAMSYPFLKLKHTQGSGMMSVLVLSFAIHEKQNSQET